MCRSQQLLETVETVADGGTAAAAHQAPGIDACLVPSIPASDEPVEAKTKDATDDAEMVGHSLAASLVPEKPETGEPTKQKTEEIEVVATHGEMVSGDGITADADPGHAALPEPEKPEKTEIAMPEESKTQEAAKAVGMTPGGDDNTSDDGPHALPVPERPEKPVISEPEKAATEQATVLHRWQCKLLSVTAWPAQRPTVILALLRRSQRIRIPKQRWRKQPKTWTGLHRPLALLDNLLRFCQSIQMVRRWFPQLLLLLPHLVLCWCQRSRRGEHLRHLPLGAADRASLRCLADCFSLQARLLNVELRSETV